jgi:DNA repair protein RadC
MSSIHQREIKTMANSKQLFKCSEKQGFYSVTEPISEQDIINFAQIIIAKRFKRGTTISSPKDSVEYFQSAIGHYEHEVFAALFLDSKHRIIAFEELFTGTIDQASVYTREIAKRALNHNAAAIIFSHNHPSGIPEPSGSDINLTQRLVSAMQLLGIKTLDHIIVAGAESISLAELGHI